MCLLFLAPEVKIFGETTDTVTDFMDMLDFDNLDKTISKGTESDVFSFGDYVKSVIKGNQKLTFRSISQVILNSLFGELKGSISILTKLSAIAVISAVFTNFSHTFKNSQVAESGYFVTYLLMIGILMASYMTAATLTKEVMQHLLDFMKVMVPAYSMSIVFCAGSGTSVVFYEAVMILITLVDSMLLKMILPMIHLYMMTMLANYLTQEEFLSKLGELIKMLVSWALKTMLALVIGIGTIQSLIAPAVDHVKSTTVMKWAAAIPGIGGLLSGVTETVLGAGTLLKNAVGVAGVISVIVICAVPLIKLAVYVLLYHAGAALIQPVADKRVLASINSCAEASMMLLKLVFVGGVLFLIVIVMAAVSTTMYI